MNIIHYSLGFPPYRSGGLTKLAMDLITQQVIDGHQVGMLWPGRMKVFNKSTSIIKSDYIISKGININSYEIINPAPVSLDEGIKRIDLFIQQGDVTAYGDFLKKLKPDVIHIHTFMGLHEALLSEAKRLKVKLVFTAHDYFPICPKVTMFTNGKICESVYECKNCSTCNQTAMSIKKIYAMQSKLYRCIKDSYLMKRMRRRHRNQFFSEIADTKTVDDSYSEMNRYKELRNYYAKLIGYIDMIHYNSTQTEKIFNEFFSITNSCVISISHADIVDYRKKKEFDDKLIKVRYLGPQRSEKGYFLLKQACDMLWNEQKNFVLHVHFTPIKQEEYMNVNDRYTYEQLGKILDETDIVIVPSVGYETFGFTVLEALSYGVPIIISDNVGAKDILAPGVGIIVDDITVENLYKTLKVLNVNALESMNEKILERQQINSVEQMASKIYTHCYGIECD